jgi:hypothetical protein
MYKVSFVVDGNPLYYYQAELLLFSLEHFAKQPKEDILVHCTQKVDSSFIDFLTRNNYSYKIIEPFLDGKYCNKIQQLHSFSEYKEQEGGAFFLDTDMFILEPLQVPDSSKFSAKIVDGPNPSLKILQKIFSKASLPIPDAISSDWIIGNNDTLPVNFNGGMYYIPFKLIPPIDTAWKKWAAWLFQKPELFELKELTMHTDQVSMALSVCELGLSYYSLTANYNFPLNSQNEIRTFEKEKPVYIIHYHRELSPFGLLGGNDFVSVKIASSLNKANKAICNSFDSTFFFGFKQSSVQSVNYTDKSRKFEKFIQKLTSKWNKKIKLILHAGTPKTGTTTLQFALHENRGEILSKGILYPNVLTETVEPKHQWIVQALYNDNVDLLIDKLELVASEVRKDTHTIFLSTEGIYNHWFDFSQVSKSYLEILANHFDLHCWIFFRKPVSFYNSLYKQYLKNPQLPDISCYGKDVSPLEMIQNNWFKRQLDYLGFICEMENLIPKNNLKIFPYSKDIMAEVSKNLGISNIKAKNNSENTSLSSSAIEILRIVNRFPLSIAQKKECLDKINELEKILSSFPQEKIAYTEADTLINELSSLTLKTLEKEFQITLKY